MGWVGERELKWEKKEEREEEGQKEKEGERKKGKGRGTGTRGGEEREGEGERAHDDKLKEQSKQSSFSLPSTLLDFWVASNLTNIPKGMF